jgi:hypothetical protein
MIYYLAIILWVIFFIAISKRVTAGVQSICLLPFVLFSMFRGNSGPDTETYIRLFSNIGKTFENSINYFYEPITSLLMYVSSNIWGDDPKYFFALHSIVLSVCFLYLCRDINRYRFFLLTIGPAFFIDGLTNTLRISMAYLFFLVSISYKPKFFFSLAFFSHVSVILSAGFYKIIESFSNTPKSKYFTLLLIIVSLVIVFLLFEFIGSFFPLVVEKLVIYQELKVTSKFSGISDIFVIFTLLSIASLYNRAKVSVFFSDFILIVLFCLGLYLLVSYSLAFLRVIKLTLIAISCAPFLVKSMKKIPSWPLVVVGGLYTINFARTIFFTNGFLPYGF